MKRNIKLTESQLNKFIVETCKKVLNEDMAYMSDEDIANQYSDMKITYFEINPLRNSEGWEGTFELEFPNADDIDYDSTMVNDFFVYDSEGNRIAWDYWMPDEQTKYLNDIIRKEIAKRSVRESITKSELKSIVEESVNRILSEAQLNELDPRTYASYANKRRAQGQNANNFSDMVKYTSKAEDGEEAARNAWNKKYGYDEKISRQGYNPGYHSQTMINTLENPYQVWTNHMNASRPWENQHNTVSDYADTIDARNTARQMRQGNGNYVKGKGWQ